jgi:hypothetical protein
LLKFISESGNTMNYFIKSRPLPSYKTNWLTKFFHKIPQNFGYVNFKYFINIIATFAKNHNTKFYSKGFEKTEFLKNVFQIYIYK